ncbi:hypothetical protein GCM10009554_40720 [Kribbella koreensis]|uniref:Uncharacterized protein n=1 Tax=Kribbella koreensis TaxID=57909 RepID=A0ABP4B3U0_9ACTN
MAAMTAALAFCTPLVALAATSANDYAATRAVLLAWSPPSSNGSSWAVRDRRAAPLDEKAKGCRSQLVARWTNKPNQQLAVIWDWCRREGDAVTNVSLVEATAGVAPAHVLVHGADRAHRNANGSLRRTWAEGRSVYNIIITCQGVVQCEAASAEMVSDLSSKVPGEVADPAGSSAIFGLLFGGPVAAWLVWLGPVRLGSRLHEESFVSSSAPPRYIDVGGVVRRARRRRFVRTVLGSVAGFCALVVVAQGTSQQWTAAGLWLVAAATLFLIRRRLPKVPLNRVTSQQRAARGVTRRLIGSSLRTVAWLAFTATVAAYLVLMAAVLAVRTGLHTIESVAARAWADGSLSAIDRFRMGLMLAADLIADEPRISLVLFAGAVLAAYGIDRLSQRLAAVSARQILAADKRPHLLYLRSFDEDSLKLRATYSRRGILNRLAIRRTRRFEEILVGYLSAFGPVIAVAPPGTRLQPIGAARASFDSDAWKASVADWSDDALAVVISATPGEVRPGYRWELDYIANGLHHSRIIAVLGPWRSGELRRRWACFLDSTVGSELFLPLRWGWVQPGGLMLTHSDTGWTAYGARRRWDWSYAMAFDAALVALHQSWLAEWAGQRRERASDTRPGLREEGSGL